MSINAYILTKPNFWQNLSPQGKGYWQKTANQYAKSGIEVCTHRPLMNGIRGTRPLRRASTGGKFGRSVDIKHVDIKVLLANGYVFVKLPDNITLSK